MSPIDGQTLMQPTGLMQNVIPLSTLIEFIVQRTYHELTVLSELLPRKSDLDRKIEIYQFANRTKQLFVRLLALVKWTNSANKVEKCARISSFLQQQQIYFVETANSLARMARETLVRAKLPCFSLPCAVDVLTTGTYPRLPHCIKEKIVPPDLLSPSEKEKVLTKLGQIIEYRIVTTELPACMCKPVLNNGRVKFLVDHEFEVTLTLMGDSPIIPWRLLNIEILVEDHENGNSSSLVHPRQVEFIHEVVQMRLVESEQPLHDLYNCLHFFCQSLQLEVLQYQTASLIREKLGEHLRVEEYVPGKSLSISYWRLTEAGKSKGKPFHQGFKVNVHVDEKKFGRSLQITHSPQILGADGVKCLKQVNVSCLSIEKIWTHTVQIRSIIKLKELKRELEVFLMLKCEMGSLPPMILVKLAPPLDEIITICVDELKGTFLVNLPESVSSYEESLAETLNSDKKDLRHLISEIRLQIVMKNYKRYINSSSMNLCDYLSNITFDEPDLKNIHVVKFNTSSKNQLVVKYEKEALNVKYYLYTASGLTMSDGSKCAVEVNPSVLKKWIVRNFDDSDKKDQKLLCDGNENLSESAWKKSTSFRDISRELAFVQMYCEDILCFVELSKELTTSKIANTGYQADPTGVGLLLVLLNFPPVEKISESVENSLKSSILSITFRLLKKERNSWSVEIIFTESPIKTKDGLNQLNFSYELGDVKSTVSSFMDDWSRICHLYQVVVPFAEIYNDPEIKKNSMSSIEVLSYTFSKIVVSYGPNNAFNMEIFYVPKSKSFRVILGVNVHLPVSNGHSITFSYLENFFNVKKSLFFLCKVLEDTCPVVSSLCKLNCSPLTWIKKTSLVPVQAFAVIPQSSFHIKVYFQSLYCLDIRIVGNQVVSVKDGCNTTINHTFSDGTNSIPGLPTFLEAFLNELQSMKIRIKKEDDTQPSPASLDQMDFALPSNVNFMGHNSPLAHKLMSSSPGQMMVHAPGNPSPSTMFVQSPASMLHFASHQNTSKLPLKPSLGNSFNLSSDAFNRLVSQYFGSGSSPGSPLDRFFGSLFFRRHLQRIFTSDDNLSIITSEPSTIVVKSDSSGLQMKFFIPAMTLRLKIFSLQESMFHWDIDDLSVLERYFESKVSIYPYKPAQLEAFCSILKLQYHILKDFILLLKLEMSPDKNSKWFVQLLLTLPYGTGLDIGLGSCAFALSRKIMFVLQFTRNSGLAPNTDTVPTVVVPFFYDTLNNYVQPVETQKQVMTTQVNSVSTIVKRFTEYSLKNNECSLFACILELVNNL